VFKRQSQHVYGRNFIVFSGLCQVCYLQRSCLEQSPLSFTDWHSLRGRAPVPHGCCQSSSIWGSETRCRSLALTTVVGLSVLSVQESLCLSRC